MGQFLAPLEHSAFFVWVRQSPSLWAYPGFLFLHTVGLGLLVGTSLAIDLRILGVARQLALAPMRRLFPVMWIGFWINAVTGTVLLIADVTTKLANPAFTYKMTFIALAIVNIFLIKWRVFSSPGIDRSSVTLAGKVLAATSVILWLAAVTAGRLMAYLGQDSGAPEFINRIGG